MTELEMEFRFSELQLETSLLLTLLMYLSLLNTSLMFDQLIFWDLYLWSPSTAPFHSSSELRCPFPLGNLDCPHPVSLSKLGDHILYE